MIEVILFLGMVTTAAIVGAAVWISGRRSRASSSKPKPRAYAVGADNDRARRKADGLGIMGINLGTFDR